MAHVKLTFETSLIGGREENQDSTFSFLDKQNEQYLFVVCDGVGGSADGGSASRKVIEVCEIMWNNKNEFQDLHNFLEKLGENANAAVKQLNDNSHDVSATTIVALAIWPGEIASIHAGDSRIYQLFPNSGKIEFTDDQSLAYTKYLRGEISREQVKSSKAKNQLLSCIDGRDPMYEIETWQASEDCYFVLCSDGFWEIFEDDELCTLLETENPAMEIENRLNHVLKGDPRHDNTSALGLKFKNESTATTTTKHTSSPWMARFFSIFAIGLILFVGANLLLPSTNEHSDEGIEATKVTPNNKADSSNEDESSQQVEANVPGNDTEPSNANQETAENFEIAENGEEPNEHSDVPTANSEEEAPDQTSEVKQSDPTTDTHNSDVDSVNQDETTDNENETTDNENEIDEFGLSRLEQKVIQNTEDGIAKSIEDQLKRDGAISEGSVLNTTNENKDAISKVNENDRGTARLKQYVEYIAEDGKIILIPIMFAEISVLSTEEQLTIVDGHVVKADLEISPLKFSMADCLEQLPNNYINAKPAGDLTRMIDGTNGHLLYRVIAIEESNQVSLVLTIDATNCKIRHQQNAKRKITDTEQVNQ